KFFKATLSGAPIDLYGDGEQTRDFTFVADAVAATHAAGLRGVPGRVYNIGGGGRGAMRDVLGLLGKSNSPTPGLRGDGAQKGDMRHTFADTSLARRDLDFMPAVDLEDGLRAEHEWLAAGVYA